MQITIVTDNTARIPRALVVRYAIRQIPAIFVIERQSLQEGLDISRQSFYQHIPAMQIRPTKATPFRLTLANIF
jgi:fatty acid-binding protein DegV